MLGNSKRYEAFESQNVDGLFYVSHACIMIHLSGKRILCDPVFTTPPHLGSHLFFPEYEYHENFFESDIVFVSHQHQDHFDPKFLKRLSSRTQIIIVEGRDHFKKKLCEHSIKFEEIREGELTEVVDNIYFKAVLHDSNGIDSAVLITNRSFSIYHGNDCYVSGEKLKEVFKSHKIDVACVPFAYIHWYPYLVDNIDQTFADFESSRLVDKYMSFGVEMIKALRPRLAIPFGANMMYYDELDHPVNQAIKTPFDFETFYSRRENDRVVKALFAGDYVIHRDQQLEVNYTQTNKAAFDECFNIFLTDIRNGPKLFDDSGFIDIDLLSLGEDSLNFIRHRISSNSLDDNIYNIYISCPGRSGSLVYISRDLQECKFVEELDNSVPFYHFKLTDYSFKAYFSGDYSFNEIIASSRFRVERSDQVYDLRVLKILNHIL